jgi:hypothetical protein
MGNLRVFDPQVPRKIVLESNHNVFGAYYISTIPFGNSLGYALPKLKPISPGIGGKCDGNASMIVVVTIVLAKLEVANDSMEIIWVNTQQLCSLSVVAACLLQSPGD